MSARTIARARPLRPVIRLGERAARGRGRRGASLYWRELFRPSTMTVIRPLAGPPSSFAINLFVKFLCEGAREKNPPSGSLPAVRQSRRSRSLRLIREQELSTRLTFKESEWHSTFLQQILERHKSLIERVRLRSILIGAGQLAGAIQEPETTLPQSSRWQFQPPEPAGSSLAPPRPGAQRPMLAPLRASMDGPFLAPSAGRLPFVRSTPSGPMSAAISRDVSEPLARKASLFKGPAVRPSASAPTSPPLAVPTDRLRRARPGPLPANGVAGGPVRSAVPLTWNLAQAKPARAAPVQAIVNSTTSPSIGAASERLLLREAGATPQQPLVPNVDKLVDEVIRRLDRQFRSERLRRGL